MKGEKTIMNEIKLLLKSKKKTTSDGKKQFRTYFTSVLILVKGEEEKGKQRKTLTVRFDESVNTKDLVRGIVVCDEKDIDLPFKYQVQHKDGKDTYPYIYIRKIKSYEEKRGQSSIEFCLEDEEETEDTVIDEEVEEQPEDNA